MPRKASIKAVRKWEKELNCKVDFDTRLGKVIKVRCKDCMRWRDRIQTLKNFSDVWISGTQNVEKDSLRKHVQNCDAHREAVRLTKLADMGAGECSRQVLRETPIGKGLLNMLSSDDKTSMVIKFNTAYYLAKKERPFSDFDDLLALQCKNGLDEKITKAYRNDKQCAVFTEYIAEETRESLAKDISNARFYACLNDGSTDTSVIEQELVYILFLSEGTPKLKFLSIESVKSGTAEGIKASIEESFERFGVTAFTDRLMGLNVDGASVNTGIHRGLGALLKETAPWLQVIHCFNHRLELALKDAFNTTTFSKIDEMLMKLYYLYQKSPKRLRELKELANAYEGDIQKPTKATGTRWLDHKFKAMEIMVANYGALMTHVESLANTDSQALKKAEIEGFVKRWKHASYPVYATICLDVLGPLKRLSMAMQQEVHDPVKTVRRIQEFTWTMTKLQALMADSLRLDEEGSVMTRYKRFMSTIEERDDGQRYYQGIKLSKFGETCSGVAESYNDAISRITNSMEKRFDDLVTSPVFRHQVSLLDTSTWPDDDAISAFGDKEIEHVANNFQQMLAKNDCNIAAILPEWQTLKAHVIPIVANDKSAKYLDVWKKIFTNCAIKHECRNALDIIEILLITPFSNAKLERMFSRMARVKNDWRNRLGRDRLDALLRIGEEGPSCEDFNPIPSIDRWYSAAVRRLTSTSHKYPEKRKKRDDGSKAKVADVTLLTMSDLEEDSENEW